MDFPCAKSAKSANDVTADLGSFSQDFPHTCYPKNVVYYGQVSYLYLLYLMRYELLSSRNFVLVTDRQNPMHLSPPCIGTGGLKNRAGITGIWVPVPD